MSNYYPGGPFRRFWFMRDRLKVGDLLPDQKAPTRGDQELFEQHLADIEAAGEDLAQVDEPGVKGFIYGLPPNLVATVRWRNGDVERNATRALLEWADDNGVALVQDDSFALEASSGDV